MLTSWAIPHIVVILTQLWTSVPHPSNVLLEGNWQSCFVDGNYEERIFDYCVGGKCLWAFHMGPKDEFALYASSGDPLNGDDHSTKANLLGPSYKVSDIPVMPVRRSWTAQVGRMFLWVSVVEAGGSQLECKSYYVKIVRRH